MVLTQRTGAGRVRANCPHHYKPCFYFAVCGCRARTGDRHRLQSALCCHRVFACSEDHVRMVRDRLQSRHHRLLAVYIALTQPPREGGLDFPARDSIIPFREIFFALALVLSGVSPSRAVPFTIVFSGSVTGSYGNPDYHRDGPSSFPSADQQPRLTTSILTVLSLMRME
jgi:hypothetical protein